MVREYVGTSDTADDGVEILGIGLTLVDEYRDDIAAESVTDLIMIKVTVDHTLNIGRDLYVGVSS